MEIEAHANFHEQLMKMDKTEARKTLLRFLMELGVTTYKITFMNSSKTVQVTWEGTSCDVDE